MSSEFAKLIANAPVVEPDEIDLEMLAEIDADADTDTEKEGISWDEYKKKREARTQNGKIALRIPKTLHQDLVEAAKEEGVSLNQYCLYKLAQ